MRVCRAGLYPAVAGGSEQAESWAREAARSLGAQSEQSRSNLQFIGTVLPAA